MIEVNSVEIVPDFGLLLIFSDGERRRFDIRPYLHYPVFRRLENPGFFRWRVLITVLLRGLVTSTLRPKRFTNIRYL